MIGDTMADEVFTFRQRMFVDAYLGEAKGNATEAARIAGYSSPHPEGSRLLRNATIQAAIAARLESSAMSAKEVLARLSDQAAADMDHFLNIPGDDADPDKPVSIGVDLRRAKQLGITHLIQEFKPTEFGPSIKIAPSRPALELLGKYHKLFTEKIDVTSDGQPIGSITWDEIESGLMDVLSPYPEARSSVAGYLSRLVLARQPKANRETPGPEPLDGGSGTGAGPVAAPGADVDSQATINALLSAIGEEHDDGGEVPRSGPA